MQVLSRDITSQKDSRNCAKCSLKLCDIYVNEPVRYTAVKNRRITLNFRNKYSNYDTFYRVVRSYGTVCVCAVSTAA